MMQLPCALSTLLEYCQNALIRLEVCFKDLIHPFNPIYFFLYHLFHYYSRKNLSLISFFLSFMSSQVLFAIMSESQNSSSKNTKVGYDHIASMEASPSGVVSLFSIATREETHHENPNTIISLPTIYKPLSIESPSTTLVDPLSLNLNSPLLSIAPPTDMSVSQPGIVVLLQSST